MATLERLFKAFEALKVFQPHTHQSEDLVRKKDQPLTSKEKILHCSTIADAITAPSLRGVPDFPKFLGIAIETFLLCCDDVDTDVRMVADECLNKTIKTLLETNLGRLQVELYKEIKKNGPSRTLRAALWRFADLCHLIRPQKCRPYVVNMMPCIAQIAHRSEESVQETLAAAMVKMCSTLGKFTNDGEVKLLLKSFLPNLKATSAVFRRTAATSLTAICQFSRKPTLFFAWLLGALIDTVVPVSPDKPVPVLLGCLLCLRHIIPHLSSEETEDTSLKGSFGVRHREPEVHVGIDKLIQVYELLLHYTQHPDHNVVTTSLEALQQLLQTPPPLLLSTLLSSHGIGRTRIFAADVQELGLYNVGAEIGSLASLVGDESGIEDDLYPCEVNSQMGTSSLDESFSMDSVSVSSVSVAQPDDEPTDEMSFRSVDDDEKTQYSNIRISTLKDGALTHAGSIGTLSRSSPRRKRTSLRKGVSDERGADEGEDEFAWDPGTTPSQSPGIDIAFQVGSIGSFTDPACPLEYCCRLLCSSFLLTGCRGRLMPDKNVRVSVKTLAIGCFSAAVSLQPQLFFLHLHKNDEDSPSDGVNQMLRDVLLFAHHPDPQLRGSAAALIGGLIKSGLRESGGKFDQWALASTPKSEAAVTLHRLVDNLLKILSDESSVACRMALQSLRAFLNPLLHSDHSQHGMKVLVALLKLGKHPYWLVKVELLELVSDIPFKTAHYLETLTFESEGDNHCRSQVTRHQDHIFSEILLPLLGDEDARVRQASATSIVRVVPKLFYAVDHPQHNPIIALAKEKTDAYLDPIIHEGSLPPHPLIHGLVQPYDTSKVKGVSLTLEMALSRVVNLLVHQLISSTSKFLTIGCCQALCLLSDEYLVTVYPYAWTCGMTGFSASSKSIFRSPTIKRQPSVSTTTDLKADSTPASSGAVGLVSMVVSLLTSTTVAMDLTAHQHALQLAGNLFAGMTFNMLQLKPDSSGDSLPAEEESWGMLKDKQVASLADNLLVHLMRMLNVMQHVIDEQAPAPPPTKTTLPSLPSAPSLSPIKRKNKVKEEASASSLATGVAQGKNTPGKSPTTGDSQDKSEKERSSSKITLSSVSGMGAFQTLPHYLRFYDVLRAAHSNYKLSLDVQGSERFSSLLRTTLNATSQVLEITSMTEIGEHAEELLRFLRSTVTMEPTATLCCVQQLLKALFGTNLSSLWEGPHQTNASRKPGRATRLTAAMSPGLYHYCFTAPYTQFMQSLSDTVVKTTPTPDSEEMGNSWLGWVKKKSERKLASLFKTIGRGGDKSSLASYIRLFEPLVIKALKQYTITSSVDLHCQVLNLLSQLVQLRVNYCLLDSDQIFIGFVIKQFEYIEEGQVQQSELLLPSIFHFLVLLSYERYHSKSIIGVPKIIQLCDGIMASGQPPTTHAIPALVPIVEDLFLMRGVVNKADAGKELDTQREVVVSMLLRLIQYHQVLEMFILILQQNRKEGEDKWKKLSRQIVDVVLPLLGNQQISLDNQVALDVLHRLFEAVAPSVFRPVDMLLKIMFAPPYNLSSLLNVQRWGAMVLAVLRVLISQSKEEVVLGRLAEIGLDVGLFSDSLHNHMQKKDSPTTLLPPHPGHLTHSPEETIARFLLQVIGMMAVEIRRRAYSPSIDINQHNFLCQQLSHLLLYIMHMFQSGIYRRVATCCMGLIKAETPPGFFSVRDINRTFLDMAPFYPTLTLQWCNVLILLNFDDQGFWREVMRTTTRRSISESRHNIDSYTPVTNSCHLEMLRMGGLILFCDYVCENLTDAEHMTWLIINHVNELVMVSSEPPVQDLIGAIHRNSAASGLFIQAIHARCENLSKPSFVKRTLSCLESIHASQNGAIVILIIDKILSTHHLAVARACDAMACHRVEMMLAESAVEGAHQFPLEDLDKHINILRSSGFARRHAQLETLLMKLRIHCFPDAQDFQSLSSSWHRDEQNLFSIKTVKSAILDKEWYLNVVREQCFQPNACGLECAQLLSKVEYEDILAVMLAKEFNLTILEDCLAQGVQLSLVTYLKTSKGSPCESPLPTSPPPVGPESALHRAAVATLLQHVGNLVELMPRPHQVFVAADATSMSPKEVKYHNRVVDVFGDRAVWEVVFQIIPVLTRYLTSLPQLPWPTEVPTESLGDLGRFCIVCLEAIHWLVVKEPRAVPQHLQLALNAVHAILWNQSIAGVIGLRDHMTWVCSAIGSIHRVMTYVLQSDSLTALPTSGMRRCYADSELQRAAQACDQAAELVLWLETVQESPLPAHRIPPFLERPLKSIIVGLARLHPVNSYSRTAPVVWQMGWSPDFGGTPRTVVPPLPIEYLQERDVLRQFIFRVNALGWTSRQQFEETWMALLGVLSATPMSDGSSIEEELERIQTSCLAVKCITALLLQTLLLPQPGNPQNSSYLHQKRDKPLAFLHTRCGKKLSVVRNIVHQKVQDLVTLEPFESNTLLVVKELYGVNLERKVSPNKYGFGQVALEYLWTAIGTLEENMEETGTVLYGSTEFHQREQCLAASGLDIHSCLHFLLDLYSQWMAPNTNPRTPLSLLMEATRSVIQLSDIFTERAQFEWMLDTLMELHRIHPPEDEIMAAHLIIGICKAAAVVGMDQEMADRLKKMVEWSLKSAHLPTRITTLYSLLHLLEQGSSEETLLFLVAAMDYIIKHIDPHVGVNTYSEEHSLVMWSLAFYILENFHKDIQELDFSSKVLQISIQVASSPEDMYPLSVYLVIIHGLERLLLAEVLTGKDAELLVKLSVDRFSQQNPLRALASLGLMLSCMYAGKENDKWSPTSITSGMELPDTYAAPTPDAESLLVAMERVTVLFDRIKKGYPFEAEVVASVLPIFLIDFFPPSDIMNKVIGEFISSQQPHPQLLASVVFQVFENVYQQSHQTLIQEWVMLSLSNFTQRSPVAMAIWSLTCFFISASTNCWIRSLFAYVQRRMGKLESFDRQMFCITALDFCNQLMDKSQRKTFRQTIASVALPDTPYADLLTCL